MLVSPVACVVAVTPILVPVNCIIGHASSSKVDRAGFGSVVVSTKNCHHFLFMLGGLFKGDGPTISLSVKIGFTGS